MSASIRTLGELRQAYGSQPRTVKEEIRENLVRKLQSGERLFPGVIGYDETVIPQLINAILSRHNFILLGLRGQAKSRILRSLVDLLDERIPVVPGCEIHDNPLNPICGACRARVAAESDSLPIGWLSREERYVEKLATPDVTIADMVGDIDPIKAAQAGLNLADELTMHYGLLPRANRGIFAINELPDLAGKIQVGLFNILQEGDVQIKGYPIRLQLDVMMVFTANPEDYTARGKIITPLKDRIGSEIRTHYPTSRRTPCRSPRRKHGPNRPGAEAGRPRLRARGGRGSRVPGASRPEDRQALGRQPASADHDARTGRLERRAPRAHQRREGRRPAGDRHLLCAAFDHRQVRARVRRRAERRRNCRARSDQGRDWSRVHRHV
ncbi:MAG: sigma 54-interacting transcriptional regulator [Vicinamibacterales bacterium]